MKMDWLAVYRKAIDPAEAVLRRERLARLRKEASRNLASALCGLPLEEREEALVRKMGDLLPEDLAAVQASIRRDAVRIGRAVARRRSLRRWAKVRLAAIRGMVGRTVFGGNRKGSGIDLSPRSVVAELLRYGCVWIVGIGFFVIVKEAGIARGWDVFMLSVLAFVAVTAGWFDVRGFAIRHGLFAALIALHVSDWAGKEPPLGGMLADWLAWSAVVAGLVMGTAKLVRLMERGRR